MGGLVAGVGSGRPRASRKVRPSGRSGRRSRAACRHGCRGDIGCRARRGCRGRSVRRLPSARGGGCGGSPRAPQWRQPRSRSSMRARSGPSGARRRRPTPTGRPPSHRTVRTSASQVSSRRWDAVRVGPRWMRDAREAVEVEVQEDLVAVPGALAGSRVGVEAGEGGVGEAGEGVGPGGAGQAAGAVVVDVVVVDVDAGAVGEHPAPGRRSGPARGPSRRRCRGRSRR